MSSEEYLAQALSRPQPPPLSTRESQDSIDPPSDLFNEVGETCTADSGFAWLLKTCSERVSSLPNATIRGKWVLSSITEPASQIAEKRRSLWDIPGSAEP